jgi:RNA polymerase sigma factor (sigma-70 family)
MAFLRKMTREEVQKAIKKLEPQQQWLIEEIFFIGRTQVDIANELGVGKTAIESRLHKIFEKLQKNL